MGSSSSRILDLLMTGNELREIFIIKIDKTIVDDFIFLKHFVDVVAKYKKLIKISFNNPNRLVIG